MPALADRGTNVVDMSGYQTVDPPSTGTSGGIAPPSLEPAINVFLRCPLPQVWDSQSDTLRQFYQGSLVPQVRVFTPFPVNSSSGGGTTTNITNISSSSSGGGSGTPTITITQTSVKTPIILSNGRYAGSFTLSRAFQLLSLAASAPCRIQLYGTSIAQSADGSRGLDSPPPAGTMQNIICDVVLDASPLQWTFQDRIGANGDNPVNSTIYISVTNLDVTSESFTISIGYVPLVS